MADLPLNESFDTSGEWYLPENPERKIAGSLHYTPERTELQLHEAFQPLQGAIHVGNTEQVYPVIHGTTRNSEAMTLLNVQRIGVSISFRLNVIRQPERLLTTLLLIGAHLPTNFAYPEIRCRVPGLQVWLSRQIIEQSLDTDQTTDNITMSYRVLGLSEETMAVPTINAILGWGISRHAKAADFTSIAVTTSGWVIIRPNAPQPIEWYFEQLGKITTLLSFLAGASMSPDCIQVSIGGEHREVSVMVTLRDAKYCQYTNLHEFYMPRGTMEAELKDVMARWFEIYPKVAMPSQLTLSVLASEKLWLHVEFLSLMQALEGFHRSLFGGSITLCKRLDALAKLLSEPIRAMILGVDRKVPRLWIDTRNYYTHWDEKLRAGVLDGQAMYYANVRMRHFLRALYLNLIGIPQQAILKSLTNASDTSQHLVQLNAIERRHTDPNDTSEVIMSMLEQKVDGVAERESSSGDVTDSDNKAKM